MKNYLPVRSSNTLNEKSDNLFDCFQLKMLLTIVDRDGTLIEFVTYLGKEEDWKDKTKLNFPVVRLLKYVQDNHLAKIYIVSNQAGVARKYFSCSRVDEINRYINEKLVDLGIRIDGWHYCPDVDNNYTKLHPETDFDIKFVKERTNRKPSINMVLATLNQDNLKLSLFKKIFVIGDAEDDEKLAENLKGMYIDIKEKTYKQLKEEFLAFVNKRKNEEGFSFRE